MSNDGQAGTYSTPVGFDGANCVPTAGPPSPVMLQVTSGPPSLPSGLVLMLHSTGAHLRHQSVVREVDQVYELTEWLRALGVPRLTDSRSQVRPLPPTNQSS